MSIRPHDYDILDKYFESIRHLPRLSPEEEEACAKMWQKDKNPEGLQRLIEGNLRYVIKEAKRYQGLGLDLIDLISEGNLGLITAAKRFDPDRKTKFLSYASPWIRQTIFHALAENGSKIRLPEKLAAQIYHLKHTIQQLEQHLGYKPSVGEIADSSNHSIKEVEKLLLMQEALKPISTEQVWGESDISIEDTLEQDVVLTAMETLEHEAHLNGLKFGLASLSAKEKHIIELHYGINGKQPMTLENIGKALTPPLSREYVRQIESRAFNKIRKHSKGIVSHFLDGNTK
ncbi:MAG: RNA polymerase sigma factor RpoD/SigA [Holophagaceae bacterium]|nr:RNA polymerase sigma factor RpoD/SigA [Holophagaceae bacterium]